MLPELFCEKMKSLLGEEYEAFLAALDRPRAVGLRLNPLKLDAARSGPMWASAPTAQQSCHSERSEESVPNQILFFKSKI